MTRCYFNWGTEGKVSPRGARCQVNHRGVNVFCLLILHVTTTRHDKLTSEIPLAVEFLPTDRHLKPEEGTSFGRSLSVKAIIAPHSPPPLGSVVNQLVNEKGQTNQDEQNIKLPS